MGQLDHKVLELDHKTLFFLNASQYPRFKRFDLILCENDAPIERFSIKITNIPKSSAVYEKTFTRVFPEDIRKEVFWEKFEDGPNLDLYIDFANLKLRNFCFEYLKEMRPEEEDFEERWKDKHSRYYLVYPEELPYTVIVFVNK